MGLGRQPGSSRRSFQLGLELFAVFAVFINQHYYFVVVGDPVALAPETRLEIDEQIMLALKNDETARNVSRQQLVRYALQERLGRRLFEKKFDVHGSAGIGLLDRWLAFFSPGIAERIAHLEMPFHP